MINKGYLQIAGTVAVLVVQYALFVKIISTNLATMETNLQTMRNAAYEIKRKGGNAYKIEQDIEKTEHEAERYRRLMVLKFWY